MNIWIGWARIANSLLLPFALLFSAMAAAQVMGGSLISGMGASGDPCASAPNRIACYKDLAGSQL